MKTNRGIEIFFNMHYLREKCIDCGFGAIMQAAYHSITTYIHWPGELGHADAAQYYVQAFTANCARALPGGSEQMRIYVHTK